MDGISDKGNVVELVPKPEQQVLPDGRVLQYPPIPRAVMNVLRVLAKGLFVSRYALSWGYYEGEQGKFDRLNKLARRIAQHKPLEVMIGEEEDPET